MTAINYQTGNVQSVPNTPWRTLADSLYTGTAPVITNTQSANSTIVNAQKWAPSGVALTGSDKVANFNYLGAGDFIIGTVVPDTNYVLPTSRYPNTYASGQSGYCVEFMYYGQIFELKYKYISTATRYRLFINDMKVSDQTVAVPGPPTAGSSNALKFDLGSVDEWKIRFEFQTMPFGGIWTGPNDSLWGTSVKPLRIAGFGDSITGGSNMNTSFGQGTWLRRFGRLIGSPDMWDQSRSGTGFINPGTFAPLGSRITKDILPYDFDHIILWAGFNDDLESQSAVYAAATAVVKRLTAETKAKVTIVGCYSPTFPATGGRTNVNAALKQIAFELDLPFIEPITGKVYDTFQREVADFGPWITGTGRAGAATGSGNADIFIGTDAVHPNDEGHKHIANLMAASWLAIFNQERV